MNYKAIILKIIKENQPLGIHKMDRLFHNTVEFSISWISIMKELRKENLIENEGYKITQQGLDYLAEHSEG